MEASLKNLSRLHPEGHPLYSPTLRRAGELHKGYALITLRYAALRFRAGASRCIQNGGRSRIETKACSGAPSSPGEILIHRSAFRAIFRADGHAAGFLSSRDRATSRSISILPRLSELNRHVGKISRLDDPSARALQTPSSRRDACCCLFPSPSLSLPLSLSLSLSLSIPAR